MQPARSGSISPQATAVKFLRTKDKRLELELASAALSCLLSRREKEPEGELCERVHSSVELCGKKCIFCDAHHILE